MEQFIINNKLKFTSVTLSLSNENGSKKYSSPPTGWNKKNHSSLLKAYKESPKTNYFFIIPSNDFIIFDTDTEEDHIRLSLLLKDEGIYSPKAITKSARGDTYPYKRHFWFSVEDEQFNEMKKHVLGSMEVFIGTNCNIGESVQSNIQEIPVLTWDLYEEIKTIFEIEMKTPKISIDSDEEEEKNDKIQPKKDKVFKSKGVTHDENLPSILKHLKPKRFIDYNDWLSIYWVFINEGFDLELFKTYSQKHYKNYDESKNESIFSSSIKQDGFKIGTLYHYLKQDNLQVFNDLQKTRTDFWKIFKELKSHSDPAYIYYSINPNKYIRSDITGWYEYNSSNILISYGKDIPCSMLNDITKTLQTLLIEQRNFIIPSNKQDDKYNEMMKSFKNAYDKCGTATYIEGIIKYLKKLYTIDDIDDLINSNVNLLAFNNMLYDNTIKDFRPIKPNDYISKTTKYNISTKSNPEMRKKITTLIRSMFETEEMTNYHLLTIALSLFGNESESFYINSGKGRNGKGVCSTIIEKALGHYYYCGESTFLTTTYKAGTANSTLYALKGVRYFLTTEPESDSETKFNIGLLKQITGNDDITTRDLYVKNITYKPHFTPFLQCNNKPKIDKIDDAIKNRFRIIDFPFAFVSNPTKPNERQNDPKLKSSLSQELINEFMLLLLEINKNKPSKIVVPKEVLNEVDSYLNANNFVKMFLDSTFTYNDDRKAIVKASELLGEYNSSGEYPNLSNVKFSEMMKMNNIPFRNMNGSKYYYGLVRIPTEDDDEELHALD